MSKHSEAIRKLVKEGWTVDKSGQVLKPNGDIRAARAKKPPGSRPPYTHFNVKYEKAVRPIYVHRLVAYLKFGEKAFELNVVVRHIDGNSTNNSWDNIQIGSQSQNMMDRSSLERRTHAEKAAAGSRKLNPEQVTEVRASKESGKSLALRFGVSETTISGIKNNKIYRNV